MVYYLLNIVEAMGQLSLTKQLNMKSEDTKASKGVGVSMDTIEEINKSPSTSNYTCYIKIEANLYRFVIL